MKLQSPLTLNVQAAFGAVMMVLLIVASSLTAAFSRPRKVPNGHSNE